MYDSYQIPPDWNFARHHAQANEPGFIVDPSQPKRLAQTVSQICPCCMNYVKSEPVYYCENDKELHFLGQGFPLYYTFLTTCIFLLLGLCLDSALVALQFDASENRCSAQEGGEKAVAAHPKAHFTALLHLNSKGGQQTCDDNFATRLAFISQAPTSPSRLLLKYISFFAHILLLMYFKYNLDHLAQYLDEIHTTPSDYSIYISGLPLGFDRNQQRIRNLILKGVPGAQIADVMIIHKLQQYFQAKDHLSHQVHLKATDLKAMQSAKTTAGLYDIQKSFGKYKAEVEEVSHKIRQNQANYFLGDAIVTLETEHQKFEVLQYLNSLESSKTQGFSRLQAIQCPEPNELSWHHVGTSTSERILSIVISWALTLLFLIVVVIGFYFLLKYKGHVVEAAYEEYNENPQQHADTYFKTRLFGIGIVVLINIFNKFIFTDVCHRFNHLQKHPTHYTSQFSFALKYILGMFFTTALMTFVVEAVIAQNYLGPLGAVEEQTYMFIFNAFFSPIVMLINPYYIVYWIYRKIYENSPYMTQERANHIVTKPHYDIGKRYAEIIKTMWFTYLYSSLLPIGAICSLLGLILYYFVDRFVLFSRSSVHGNITRHLSSYMYKLLEFTVILKPLGQIVFDAALRHQQSRESFIMLIIGILFVLLPISSVLKYVFPQRFALADERFSETQQRLTDSYRAHYPLRQKNYLFDNLKGNSKFVEQVKTGPSAPSQSWYYPGTVPQ